MSMHCAIILAQIALYTAVLVPFFSDQILELDGTRIGWWGWGVAALGPVATLILCELCKIVTGFQIRQHQRRLAKAVLDEDAPSIKQEPEGLVERVKSGEIFRTDSY